MDVNFYRQCLKFLTFLFFVFYGYSSFAAQSFHVWNAEHYLKNTLRDFYINNSVKADFYNDNSAVSANDVRNYLYSNNTPAHHSRRDSFQLQNMRIDSLGFTHVRYNQYYQSIPVWGRQVIFHKNIKQPNAVWQVTGIISTHIEDDIKNVTPRYRPRQALTFARHYFQVYSGGAWEIQSPQVQRIVYVPQTAQNRATKAEKSEAKLAYAVTFLARKGSQIQKPFFIMDANDLTIYQTWNDLKTEATAIGQGPGGNEKDFQGGIYRFQYGPDSKPGWSQLGKFDVTQSGSECALANSDIEVASLNNQAYVSDITIYYYPTNEELNYPTFSYTCNSYNLTDGGQSPINGGYSPNNDAMYAASNTVNMLRNEYGFTHPFAASGVTRLYTHLTDYANAYALSAGEDTQGRKWHQQVILGAGDDADDYPMTAGDTISHELGHIFTGLRSELIYANQSGGMNEAFSDMTAMAYKKYIHDKYSWYLVDWSIGKLESKVNGSQHGLPLRYFDDPTKDGHSIDNAANYYDGMDVHYSSGVYNKAFYLVSVGFGTESNPDVSTAYQLFANANADYWANNADFDSGCAGVAQEAANRGLSTSIVKNAFSQVGVQCLQ